MINAWQILSSVAVKLPLQTLDRFQQSPLLLVHLAEVFSKSCVLGLHSCDFGLEVACFRCLSVYFLGCLNENPEPRRSPYPNCLARLLGIARWQRA